MTHEVKNGGPVDQGQDADASGKLWQDKILTPKKMTNDYMAIQETMQAGLKPPWALYDTFMQEADLMAAYKRHGKDYYKEISFISSKFKEAFAENDIERMVDLYDDLESMRLQLHRMHNYSI